MSTVHNGGYRLDSDTFMYSAPVESNRLSMCTFCYMFVWGMVDGLFYLSFQFSKSLKD